MTLRQFVTDAQMKSMNLAHRTILHLSGGRALARPLGMAAVELHTTGRKSGRRRSTMLTAPIIDDQRVVLVASKGGDDRNPDWFVNLCANPEVELTIVPTGETRRTRARVASAEEKAEMWPAIVAANKGYAGYQKRTQRVIPVVICETSPV